jgi:hypothetical protein
MSLLLQHLSNPVAIIACPFEPARASAGIRNDFRKQKFQVPEQIVIGYCQYIPAFYRLVDTDIQEKDKA